MPDYELQSQMGHGQALRDGVTVIGEAVRRATPESAEFLIEVTTSGAGASQALRENHAKVAQIGQAIAALGVQPADVQTISFNVFGLYAPAMNSLPGYNGMAQIGMPGLQPDMQFGTYHARNVLRVTVRETGRVGEIVDAAARAGATVAGVFSFKVSDESLARRAALEAAGRDARAKAEMLAAAAGKKIGEPVAIGEEIVASNGAYAALRSAVPFLLGAGAPQVSGELEYYARVAANFRFV